MSGAIHRGWTELKATVTGHSTSSIVAEAERGEDVAVEMYRKAMQEPLPPQARELVQRQYALVKAAHDRVRDLEKALST